MFDYVHTPQPLPKYYLFEKEYTIVANSRFFLQILHR